MRPLPNLPTAVFTVDSTLLPLLLQFRLGTLFSVKQPTCFNGYQARVADAAGCCHS